MNPIHVKITTPNGLYKELDTEMLNVETIEGQRGLNHGHMPIVLPLAIGQMHTYEDGERNDYAVAGGICYFRNNVAEIMTDAIENKKEIDIKRAESAKERAEGRLSQSKPNLDVKRAQIALAKALNRLKVSGQ